MFDEPQGFDFYQAVFLLQNRNRRAVPVGEGADPAKEAVRFVSSTRFDFPASDIERLDASPEVDGVPTMRVPFLSLGGAHGPLPKPYTEILLERDWRGDGAFRAFLDIFHHRLISILWRVRERSRVGFSRRQPGGDEMSQHLLAVVGLGTAGLRGRMRIEDRALLLYVDHFAHSQRSMVGLERLLSSYFATKIVGRAFSGRWYTLEQDQLTAIGTHQGRNHRLGRGCVLGFRVFDVQSKFDVELPRLDFRRFLDFLPTGDAFIPLCELTRLYVGEEFEFDLVIGLEPHDVPESRLGGARAARLGWTSWLKTVPYAGPAPKIRVSAPALPPELKRLRVALFADLTLEELRLVAGRMEARSFPEGMVVFNQGTAGRSLFIIVHGAVRVERRGLDGRSIHLDTIQEGDWFGEMALLSEEPRSATIITTEDSEMLELNRADFDDIVSLHPRVLTALKEYTAARIRERRRRGYEF